MDVSSQNVTFDQTVVPYISIDRAAPNPSLTKHKTLTCEKAPTSLYDTAKKEYMTEKAQQLSPMNDKDVVNNIFMHEAAPICIRFRIRWCGYTSKDDSHEPGTHIPEHIAIGYGKSRPACLYRQQHPGRTPPNKSQKVEAEYGVWCPIPVTKENYNSYKIFH